MPEHQRLSERIQSVYQSRLTFELEYSNVLSGSKSKCEGKCSEQ
jgi:hypothetical protein